MIQLPLLGQTTGDASQGYSALVEWAYGQDQELVNGMQYYNRHSRSMGHPYLMEGWAHQGSVTIRGKLYSDIWLKYDIHAQQVEVEYRTINGANNQVILVGDRVDDFTIGEYYFRKMKLGEEQEKFYQVLGEGRMVWYIWWEKKLVPVSGDSRFIEEFTNAKRSYLLELDGSVNAFYNKKSFAKLFPKTIQKDMKRLMKMNHLQVRSASPEQLELFILAATHLLNGGGD
ncbi:MAG: hypothetical protein K8R52_05965 [Bacteroidales bacterium]|nr:hypothetical protein [Bacteroidales bacterium]